MRRDHSDPLLTLFCVVAVTLLATWAGLAVHSPAVVASSCGECPPCFECEAGCLTNETGGVDLIWSDPVYVPPERDVIMLDYPDTSVIPLGPSVPLWD